MTEPKNQVFISFRGIDVRKNFVSFLEERLKRGCVNYYLDHNESKGEPLDILLQRIEESRLVLVILSQNYLDSKWCMKELLKINETMGPTLKAIPIFYNVTVEDVKEKWTVSERVRQELEEETREETVQKVKDALLNLTRHLGMRSDEHNDDVKFLDAIVNVVKKELMEFAEKEGKVENLNKLFGITQRQEKLKEKLKLEKGNKETRIIGVLGMAGIGKTTLVEKLFEEEKREFHQRMFFKDINKTCIRYGTINLRIRILKKLLKKKNLDITEGTTHESVEKHLLESKVILVLDNVRNKEQLEYLLGNRNWIKEGSKIVIVTSDKSLVDGFVDDVYVVPGLNEREGLDCFRHHAICVNRGISIPEENLTKLSREFVDYARGNPLALKVLCLELRGRDGAHWELMLRKLAQSPSKTIQDVLNVSYDGLSQQQKDAFLDVTCFFKSDKHNFVTALVDSSSNDDRSDIKDLADKFLIEISGGRVEMHGLLYTLGKKLASQQHQRLLKHQEIMRVLKKKQGKIIVKDIRGMFLDMSEVVDIEALGKDAFSGMNNLRYLKIYNSSFPRDYGVDCKLTYPDGLELPLPEIRYLHWLKFPEEELPQDFNPENLIDLKLPHSKIKRLWDGNKVTQICSGFKDTTNLKWVDLSHSIDLCDISGLIGAQNLQRLNLEGCTGLELLPDEMETMESLVVLNLNGCTNLVSLAEMNMKSLKTLILSNCSRLRKFQVISESIEALYLNATALKVLPPSIIKLQKLVLLNMKDCKELESVPNCLGKMNALQEVILSGCEKLKSFPDLEESMRRLRVLLLDGTSIEQVPKLLQNYSLSRWPRRGLKSMPLLRHLCLRGNNEIQTLHPQIGQLHLLKCIDLKYCKKLTSVPTLPPNLQCLDAHGCESLTTVGNPLAFLILTDQTHSTFIFSNCHKLDEAAKTSIISYIQKKTQLTSHALDRYNLDSVVESFIGACFPGSEIPSWLSHQTSGSQILMPELRRHWNNNKITGVALCAVISFTDYQEQSHRSLVTCTCEFKNADSSFKRFSCTVGVIKPQKLQSEHVFIGYTSWYQIKKQKEAEGEEKDCSSSQDGKAYLRFEVTDGTGEVVKNCQVLQCGFSLVYEADEIDSVSWEVTDPRKSDRWVKKPLRLLCFVVSIYVGAAFVLRKVNIKR